MIDYLTNLENIKPEHLEGFFVGWKHPLSPEQLYQILRNSSYFVIAYDTEVKRVVGFVNVLSDVVNFAFIPMIEVLPAYQKRGIGTELMKRILHILSHISCIDLTCDVNMQSFYKRFGMVESNGMMIRK
jgi:ribosomal protein S18 acetylase RimI-like enzyme